MLRWTYDWNGFYLHFVKLLGNHIIGYIHSDYWEGHLCVEGCLPSTWHWGWRRWLWDLAQLRCGPRGRPSSLGIKAFVRDIVAPRMISKASPKSPFLYIIYIFSKVFQENCYSLKMLLHISEYNTELPFPFFLFQTISHLHETNIFKSVFDPAAVLPCAILVLCLEHKNHFQSN